VRAALILSDVAHGLSMILLFLLSPKVGKNLLIVEDHTILAPDPAQKLNPSINVELVVGQEVFGRHAGGW
jgi:hypothetical protein